MGRQYYILSWTRPHPSKDLYTLNFVLVLLGFRTDCCNFRENIIRISIIYGKCVDILCLRITEIATPLHSLAQNLSHFHCPLF